MGEEKDFKLNALGNEDECLLVLLSARFNTFKICDLEKSKIVQEKHAKQKYIITKFYVQMFDIRPYFI